MPARAALPFVPIAPDPTPVEELANLRQALGGGPRLLIKRDDAIPFAFGGNKVRKMRYVAAAAVEQGAHTLITCGGVQSNHARVTAAFAARLGLSCILIANGEPQSRPTANALLDRLLGAEVRYVRDRSERPLAMEAAAAEERARGRRPYVIPIGASIPLGALAFVDAMHELRDQGVSPNVIIHSTSSGGTQAGLVAGCASVSPATRVIGVSADEAAASLAADIRAIMAGLPALLGTAPETMASADVAVDDRFVGDGYGIPTAESQAALELAARTEGLFLDPTYTAKAMAGLIARVRAGEFDRDETVLFWHTGGQVGLFA